jgi:hypothetical protein
MIKVTGYETKARYTQIHWEQDVVEGMMGPLIGLGFLEQYMGAYGTSSEDTIDYLLADPLYDDIDVPPMDDPEAPTKIAELLKRVEGRIEWAIDKAQLIADMSLDEDTAETVREGWARAREEMLFGEDLTHREAGLQLKARQDAYSEGVQRREEEILAGEFISSMSPEERRAPRDADSSVPVAPEVGWAIQFVD